MKRKTEVFLGFTLVLFLSIYGCLLVRHWALQTQELRLRREIEGLADIMFYEAFRNDEPLMMPTGDVRDLYAWLTEDKRKDRPDSVWAIWQREGEPSLLDKDGATFRDIWAGQLIYRFPSNRMESLFEIYSVGPNGVDEGGAGDDISCGSRADFRSHVDFFDKGVVEPGWVRANLGRLDRNPHDRSIHGVAPTRAFRGEAPVTGGE